ncbi:hypothetical protein CYMTET_12472 [Cymbomonas tetramitiformis]|uniref:Uncharacterized protein n=1 Tax=Cymbomonas tetramitiformis TaxID=36881 RepID=A0AAE0GLL0_9CHLO|nr:hypothetical protein CYMTET_12472 [Cymbomonas tetramitiformis]
MGPKVKTEALKSGSGTPPDNFEDVESTPNVVSNESVQVRLLEAVQQLSNRMTTLTVRVEEMETCGKAEAGAEDERAAGVKWDALTGFSRSWRS